MLCHSTPWLALALALFIAPSACGGEASVPVARELGGPSGGGGAVPRATGGEAEGGAPAGGAGGALYESGRLSCLKPVASSFGPNPYVYSVDWSPIDDYVLSGTTDSLRLLAVDREAPALTVVATYAQPKNIYVKWSHDGRYALSVSADVRLLEVNRDPAGFTEVARYTGHEDDIYGVFWSPDGNYALTVSKDQTLRLLAVDGDQALLEIRAIFTGHAGKVFSAAWSPDQRNALSAGQDSTLRLLAVDTEHGFLKEIASITDPGWETVVAWGAAPRPALSGDWGAVNQVSMWSVDQGRGTLALEGILTTHPEVGMDVLEWSRDGGFLLTGSHDDTLKLFAYDPDSGSFTERSTLDNWQHGVHAASWAPDERNVVMAASHTDHVVLLDTQSCLQ
jgi:WD40 repeat protein